jgi:outer membrane autotransporter protein
MQKLLSTTSRAAIAAAALSAMASVAFAADATIVNGQTATTTQNVDAPDTLTVEEGGAINVVDDGEAVTIGGSASGTVTLDNYGTIDATGDDAQHTIVVNEADGDQPLTVIINNYETGVISSGNNSNRDVIRPTDDNTTTFINNWGTIIHNGVDEGSTSSGDAIDFQDKDGLGQTVNNYETGLIEGNRHGITGDIPVTVTNEGTIKGRNGSGINIDGNGVIVTNKATGTITGDYRGTGEGDGDAIDVDGDLTLDNWGRIEGLDAGGFNDGEQNFAEGLAIGGGTINNYAGGEIYGKGNGILADDSSGSGTDIVTTIYNEGLIEAADYDAIRLIGDNDDEIVNKGTIRAGEHGVAIDMGDGQDTLTLFTGSTVEGLIDGGLGSNTLNLDGIGEGTLGDNLLNFHDLNVDSGRWTLDGTHNYEFVYVWQDATLVIDEEVSQLIVDPNGSLTVYGRLEASGELAQTELQGGTLAVAGDEIGTLTFEDRLNLSDEFVYNDDFSQLLSVRSATLEVTVDADGNSDFITVTNVDNEANLQAYSGETQGFTYGPYMSVQALAGDYEDEQSYHIIHIDGTFEGNGFREDVLTNFAFLDASLDYQTGNTGEYDTADVYLNLVRNDVEFQDIAETPNQTEVAKAIGAAGGSNLHGAITVMTVEDAKNAYDALSGEAHPTTSGVLVTQTNLVNGTIDDRFETAFGTGGGGGADLVAGDDWEAAPATGSRYAGWVKGYGSWLEADGDGNAAGIDGTAGGVLLGFDVASANGLLGLAVGYGMADVSVDSRASETDTETFLLAAYGAYRFDAVRFSGGVSYGAASIDSERHVLDETPTASYDGTTAGAFGEVAYEGRMGGVGFQPFAGLAYTNVDLDGFTEENAPVSGLTSDGQSFDSLSSTIGLRVAYDMAMGDGMVVTPKASAGWRHAYGEVTPETVMTFEDTGTSFAVQGLPIAEDTAVLEAGLDMAITPNATLGILYSGQFAEEASSNSVKGTAALKF